MISFEIANCPLISMIPIPGVSRLRQTPVPKRVEIKSDPGIRRSVLRMIRASVGQITHLCIRSIFLDGLMVVAIALVF
ncbi:MAG: hypothetical protein R2827_09275 [Bdellovibrionales bacterium]